MSIDTHEGWQRRTMHSKASNQAPEYYTQRPVLRPTSGPFEPCPETWAELEATYRHAWLIEQSLRASGISQFAIDRALQNWRENDR